MFDPQGRQGQSHEAGSSKKLPLTREALRNATRGLSTFETFNGLARYPVRVVTMPVMKDGRPSNVIQVGMSLQSLQETRSRFLLVMVGLFPMGLMLAGLGGWLLAHRALKPVGRMSEAADRISAECLAERVEETGTGDELDVLAQTLNRMLGRLDSAFTQIRRFTADASHELQTPLTILKGEIEVALRSTRSPEEYQGTLRSALEEIDRITEMVEGLLLMARTEAGVLRIDRQAVDLAQLAEDVIRRMKVFAQSCSVELTCGPMESALAYGDREHLGRLLLNLLENGIKYTGPGGRVALSVQKQDGWSVVDVSDDGIGISNEDRER
ncbi:MAG TPA: histidine kinase dimerization/phospho-acceptor domain-containing protein, partial [Methanomicrobiales archaeon]|nr:histidine kinase dimerization/phospho-acceptor domain-containing protein [Methanomicrobiales archaeon]